MRYLFSTHADIAPTALDIFTAVGLVIFFMVLVAAVVWPDRDSA
jgi:hypothetical protein